MKKFIHVLSIILHPCIKFQWQISNDKESVKKDNCWQMYSQKSVRKFSFLLQINYNKFNIEILYTAGVGLKEYV
jgi:hypothetical protein